MTTPFLVVCRWIRRVQLEGRVTHDRCMIRLYTAVPLGPPHLVSSLTIPHRQPPQAPYKRLLRQDESHLYVTLGSYKAGEDIHLHPRESFDELHDSERHAAILFLFLFSVELLSTEAVPM